MSAGATSRLLTTLTVPMFLLPSLGAKLAAKLPARRYFAGGLAIVGGADLLLALEARGLSAPTAIWEIGGNGAPERIRTSDPQIRSLVLYPAELRARAVPSGVAASTERVT